MKRRDFLIGSAIVAGSTVKFWGQDSDKAKLARIAIMTACFSSVVKSSAHPNDPKRTFELLDLPQVFAEHYGVHYLEPTCSHFTSTEKDYLDEFQVRLKKAGSQLNQISLGAISEQPGQSYGILNISSDNPVFRLEAIDLTKRWIDHAAYLRCPRVMVNQGLLLPEVRKETIETLKIMTDYGKSKNVKVTMETRGGGGGDALAGAAAAAAKRRAGPGANLLVARAKYPMPAIGECLRKCSRAPVRGRTSTWAITPMRKSAMPVCA